MDLLGLVCRGGAFMDLTCAGRTYRCLISHLELFFVSLELFPRHIVQVGGADPIGIGVAMGVNLVHS